MPGTKPGLPYISRSSVGSPVAWPFLSFPVSQTSLYFRLNPIHFFARFNSAFSNVASEGSPSAFNQPVDEAAPLPWVSWRHSAHVNIWALLLQYLGKWGHHWGTVVKPLLQIWLIHLRAWEGRARFWSAWVPSAHIGIRDGVPDCWLCLAQLWVSRSFKERSNVWKTFLFFLLSLITLPFK